MSFWVELAIIIILSYHEHELGIILGICWVIGKFISTEVNVEKTFNALYEKLEEMENKLDELKRRVDRR